MATPKPTIILVPGGWHLPTSFTPTTSLLEAAGYTCVGVPLASVGADPQIDSFDPDTAAIRAAVENEVVDNDRDVIVLFHSYSSVPGGEAVKGMDKASRRKEGGRGGVVGLFYCAAFVPPRGASLMDMLNGTDLPWFNVSSDKKTVTPEDPRTIFYADVPEPLATENLSALKTHSYQTFFSKTTWCPWETIASTYLFCTEDNAIPLEVQRGMVEGSKKGKVEWREETAEGASHSPFLSQPALVAAAVRRAAGEVV